MTPPTTSAMEDGELKIKLTVPIPDGRGACNQSLSVLCV